MPVPKILILTGDAAESMEVMYPYYRLKEAGAQVVVIDEPTAELDRESATAVLASIRAASATGTAFVVATHDPDVLAIADTTLDLTRRRPAPPSNRLLLDRPRGDVVLRAEGLRKSYGEAVALADVTLELRAGQLGVVVGRSGSGKSTLLHIMGGLDRRYTGKASVLGHDLHALDDRRLARFRNRQRPRYGFYVDHVVDALCVLSLFGGLGLSGLMSWPIAIGLLIAYLLLMVEASLATYTLGTFQISFWAFSPTELRILLAIGNLAMFIRGPQAHLLHHSWLLFDVGGAIGAAGMLLVFLIAALKNGLQLYREEKLADA